MPESFKVLRLFSIALKVYAFLVLFLVSIGLVGLVINRNSLPGQPVQLILDFLFKGSLSFVVLYSFSDLIRLLLSIKAELDKKS